MYDKVYYLYISAKKYIFYKTTYDCVARQNYFQQDVASSVETYSKSKNVGTPGY